MVKGERKKGLRGAFVLLLFPLAISLFLNGCGFHLRGAVELPAVMERTYVAGGAGSDLYYELENALLAAGAEVVDSPGNASGVLTLQSQRIDRRVLSVDTQGRAAEYELALQVVFSLRDSAGKPIADNERVSIVRDYSFDPDNVLSKSDEEEALRKEMYRLAVAQMVRRVQSLARRQAGE